MSELDERAARTAKKAPSTSVHAATARNTYALGLSPWVASPSAIPPLTIVKPIQISAMR